MQVNESDDISRSADDSRGRLVVGTVTSVHPYGVFVDLGLEYVGFIDPVYIENDVYHVGDRVEAYIYGFRDWNHQYALRPKGKMPISEWLRRRAGSDT